MGRKLFQRIILMILVLSLLIGNLASCQIIISKQDKKGTDTSETNNNVPDTSDASEASLQVLVDGKGTTTVSEKTYRLNSVVSVTAIPAVGSVFDGWYDVYNILQSSDRTYQFVITQDTVLKARFKQANEEVLSDNLVGSYSETDLMSVDEEFRIVVECHQPDPVQYILDHMQILDRFFLDSDNNIIDQSLYIGNELVPCSELAPLSLDASDSWHFESLGNGLYAVYPAEQYVKGCSYVVKGDENLTFYRVKSQYATGGGVMSMSYSASGDAVIESGSIYHDVSLLREGAEQQIANDEGVDEFTFEIIDEEHETIRLCSNVLIFATEDNVNVGKYYGSEKENVDGHILDVINGGVCKISGYNNGEPVLIEGEEGGFTYCKHDASVELKVGDLIMFGGNVVHNQTQDGDVISAKDITFDTICGTVYDITLCGEESGYAVYYVKIVEATRPEDFFQEIDVYLEDNEQNTELQLDEDAEQTIINAVLENEECVKLLLATVAATDQYAAENNLLLEDNSLQALAQQLSIKPSVKREGNGFKITITMEWEKSFSENNKDMKTSGKISFKLDVTDLISIDSDFNWKYRDKKGLFGITYKVTNGFSLDFNASNKFDVNLDVSVSYSEHTGEYYVLNTNSHVFHDPNCFHVKQMLETNKKKVTQKSSSLIEEGNRPCKHCLKDLQTEYNETVDFNEKVANILSVGEFGDAVDKVKSLFNSSGKSDNQSSSDALIGMLYFHFGIVSAEIKLYFYLDLDIEAALHFKYQNETTMGVYLEATMNGIVANKYEKTTNLYELNLSGKVSVGAGVRLEVNVSSPIGSISVGIYGKVGAYAELRGVIHIQNGQSVRAANIELGIELEAGVTYRALWVIHGNIQIVKVKQPILSLGYKTAITSFANDLSSAMIEENREYSLDDLKITEVNSYDVVQFKNSVTTFDPQKLGCRIEMALLNGDQSCFTIRDNKISVNENFDPATNDRDVLTVRFVKNNNGWSKNISDETYLKLPTVEMEIQVNFVCDEHYFTMLEEVPPTCTETGLAACVTCTNCHKLFSTDMETVLSGRVVIPALGHQAEEIPAVAPTCTSTGLTAGQKCVLCDEVLEEQTIVAVTPHIAGEKQTLRAADCTRTGLWEIRCEECDTVLESGYVLPHGHKLIGSDKLTCEESVRCETCGEVAAPTGHQWKIEPTTYPTCETEGQITEYCSKCHKTRITSLSKLDHSVFLANTDGYAIIGYQAADCSTDGYWKYTCPCGIEHEERIPKNDHVIGDWINSAPATCTAEGTVGHYQCAVCLQNLDSTMAVITTVVIPKKDHVMVYYEPVEKTCTSAGNTGYYYCSQCNSYYADEEGSVAVDYSDTVILASHEWKTIAAVEVSCTDNGHSQYKQCKICGIREGYEEYPAWNHPGAVWVEGELANCDLGGTLAHFECPVCRKNLDADMKELASVTIAAGEHIFSSITQKAATCEEIGYALDCKYCTRCFHYYTEDGEMLQREQVVVAPLGHLWDSEYECCDRICVRAGCDAELLATASHAFASDESENCMICGQSMMFTLTYNVNGSAFFEISVRAGNTIAYADVQKTGHTLSAWTAYEGSRKVPAPEKMPDHPLTVYATATPISYQVTLRTDTEDYGSLAGDGWYPYGSTVTLTATPKPWAEFVCWSNGDTNPTTTVEVGLENDIVATFRKSTYKVTFDDPAYDPLNVRYGDKITLPTPAKQGYDFVGWFRDTAGTQSFIDTVFYETGDLTLYPKYSPSLYTPYHVQFFEEELDGSFVLKNDILLHGTTGTLTAATAEDNIPGFAMQDFAQAIIAADGSTVVKVYYTRKYYSVTWNLNGGTVKNNDYTSEKVKFGTPLVPPEITYTGYILDGFTKNGSGDVLISSVLRGMTVTEDLSFVAQKTAKKIKVTLDLNDGLGSTLGTMSMTYDETGKLPTQSPTRNGYLFKGWATAANGIAVYQPGDTVKNLSDGSPVTLYAVWESYLNYTLLEDGTYEISAKDKNNLPSVIILPSTYNGKAVTSIGSSAFYGCTGLTSITIPDSITSIGVGAFSGCSSLQEMTIPFVGAQAGLTSSDTYAYSFGWIFGRSSYTDGVATTQYYYGSSTSTTNSLTYYIPSSLKSVTVAGGYIPYGAFYNCSNLTSIMLGENVTSIGSYAFFDCSSLTSITIGSGVTSIGNYAFYNCSSLTSITIPSSVTSIGSSAFRYCSKLTSITIGSGVTSIGSSAFDSCSRLNAVYITDLAKWCGISFNNYSANPIYYAHNLYLNNVLITDLVIPEGVTSIGSYAFRDCSNLASVTFAENSKCTSIGSLAFYGCSSLNAVYITDLAKWCVISFGNNSANPLYYAHDLYLNNVLITNLVIPEGVTSIGSEAFRGCSSLTSITIPSSVTSIGSYAFQNCSSLTSITIPSGVTSIGSYAFYNCSSLSSITIPSSVTSIGDLAFYNCSSLTSVTIPDSVTSIGSEAFRGCSSLTSITIPFVGAKAGLTSSSTYQYPFGYIFGKSSYTGGVATTQTYYGSSTSSTTSSTYYIPSSLKSVTVTGGNILYGAFYNCSNLTSITIPDNVTSIGSDAFYGCTSLTSITIPNGVTKIAPAAFCDCTSLASVTIPNSVELIYDYAFYGCTGLTSVTIPNSVTIIGDSAFYGCTGLTSVTIPNSVTIIDVCAFENCTGLTSVEIGSGITTIGSYAFSDCNSLTYIRIHRYEADVTVSSDSFPEGVTPEYDVVSSSCLVKGTLIMLPDGSMAKIETLSVGDTVLTFDHSTGEYLSSQIAFTFYANTEILVTALEFSEGTVLKLANGGHGLFDSTLNRYVLITPDNVNEFVGHTFRRVTMVDGEAVASDETLVSYRITTERVERYDIATANQLNHIAEGFLACSDTLVGFCNVFDFNENAIRDDEKMEADIREYGLYSYDGWSEYVSYEEFSAFNGQYFKIAIEKGLMTEEELFSLINDLRNMWEA